MPDPGAAGRAPEATPPASSPSAGSAETCNGIDDDGDSHVDGAACGAVCTAGNIDALSRGLRLPHEGDLTVPSDSSVAPELVAMKSVPEFCRSAPTSIWTAPDIDVGCGDVLVLDDKGLRARSLRIAPGGVVRLAADATIALEELLLVCPGAVVEGGVGNVRVAPADPHLLDGRVMRIMSRVAVILGTVESRGAIALGTSSRGGDGGPLTLDVERLLLAGAIRLGVPGPNRGEKGGDFRIVATHESFISGTIETSGPASGFVKVPVCCAE